MVERAYAKSVLGPVTAFTPSIIVDLAFLGSGRAEAIFSVLASTTKSILV